MFLYLMSLTIILLTIMLVGFYWKYLRMTADFARFQGAARKLFQQVPVPAKLQFSSLPVTELWRSLLTLSAGLRQGERERGIPLEVIRLGSRLTNTCEQVSSAVQEVAKILEEYTRPEVSAIAILLRDGKSGELRLEHLSGLPRGRIESALLMYFDSIVDSAEERPKDEEGVENYCFASAQSPLFDFSAFDISFSLSMPLRNHNGICGALWLGFRNGASSLSTPRKAFVSAIAEHAAACFYAAQKVRTHTEAREQERDLFLGMSHDLRSPGNTALYALRDILAGELGSLNTEQYLRLTLAADCLDEQLGILGDVFDYAKHQRGLLVAKRCKIAINEIVNRSVEHFSFLAERSGLFLICDAIPTKQVFVDPHHLKRILANLLSNAVKYTETGEIRLSFVTTCAHLEIRVIDSGDGIPADQQHRLFQQFSRLDNSHSKQGIGIGLALSKALVEQNKGYLRYEPNPANGAVFIVGLELVSTPTWSRSDPSQEHFAEQSHNEYGHGGCDQDGDDGTKFKSILVVDDDPGAQRTIARFLQTVAHSFLYASNGNDALFLAETTKPDLIIADYYLYGHTAEVFLEMLSKRGIDIPLIVLTGSSQTKLQELEAKFHVLVLEKPITREVLLSAVKDFFR